MRMIRLIGARGGGDDDAVVNQRGFEGGRATIDAESDHRRTVAEIASGDKRRDAAALRSADGLALTPALSRKRERETPLSRAKEKVAMGRRKTPVANDGLWRWMKGARLKAAR
jgi:hypothetical protein